jgi:HSP20 family protein
MILLDVCMYGLNPNKEDIMEGKDIQFQEKKEVKAQGELTHEGPFFIPNIDIFEDGDTIILMADMPGVSKNNIDIQVEDSQLRIQGKVSKEMPGEYVLSEYSIGDYFCSFALSNTIDQSAIKASMKNGVLRVVLPKSEKSKPRKITIKSN